MLVVVAAVAFLVDTTLSQAYARESAFADSLPHTAAIDRYDIRYSP
ncbi:MAG: hypothetical protein BWX50_01492 [Euryarchaeota archaeon ADurb.Bin009]|nr:MAG: hypothetical protein BWX50_01492 [Euryarchaeota archaeon ADurb.Bin009]HNQ33897.1 hypothetical protein [Methanoculleus sp.]